MDSFLTKKAKSKRKIIPYPKDRKLTADLFAISLQQPNIFGLTELDVTIPMKNINEMKKNKIKISFLAFIVKCLAEAVNSHKLVQGMKKGKNKIVIFDDVDVCTILEPEELWKKVPLTYIVRKAQEKSLSTINDEIQKAKETREEKYIEMEKTIDNLLKIPRWIRRKVIERKYRKDPDFRKKHAGTVCLTSIGAYFSGRAGWAIPISSNPLFVILGGIEEKPVVRKNEIVIRKMLNVTVVFNHDIIDGAPAANFVRTFGELVEEGFGLKFNG